MKVDGFLIAADRAEGEDAAAGRQGCAGRPPIPESLDEEFTAGALHDLYPAFDTTFSGGVVSPIRREGLEDVRGVRVPAGKSAVRAVRRRRADVCPVRVAAGVVDVEGFQDLRPDAFTGPPADPRHRPAVSQGHPHPVGAAVSVLEILRETVVVWAGQSIEEFDLLQTGDGKTRSLVT
ncbi:hypothetical protein [Streptomyces chartreusis]